MNPRLRKKPFSIPVWSGIWISSNKYLMLSLQTAYLMILLIFPIRCIRGTYLEVINQKRPHQRPFLCL